MKKLLYLLSLLVIASMVLSACGSAADPGCVPTNGCIQLISDRVMVTFHGPAVQDASMIVTDNTKFIVNWGGQTYEMSVASQISVYKFTEIDSKCTSVSGSEMTKAACGEYISIEVEEGNHPAMEFDDVQEIEIDKDNESFNYPQAVNPNIWINNISISSIRSLAGVVWNGDQAVFYDGAMLGNSDFYFTTQTETYHVQIEPNVCINHVMLQLKVEEYHFQLVPC